MAPETKQDEQIKLEVMTPLLQKEIYAQIAARHTESVIKLIKQLHPADVADLLENLDTHDRDYVLEIFGKDLDPEVISYLEDEYLEDILDKLGVGSVAHLITELESDDAVSVIEEMGRHDQMEVLAAIPSRDRAILVEGLTYPEDSAGRLMQRELVAVPPHWTVGQITDILRSGTDLPEDFYAIFVVDPKHKPVGVINLSRLISTKREVVASDIMQESFTGIPATMDQEDVAHLFRKYGLVSAPVTDVDGRLVGVIMVDDVVDVIDEEAEEDLLLLGGLSSTNAASSMLETAWHRLPWLLVNLGAAFTASFVISQFQGTINHLIALAILMPIIPSLGGNTGTQALTVAVRTLALRELRGENSRKLIFKEAYVGLINSLCISVVTGLVSWLWFRDLKLSIIVGGAIIANMLIAALLGVLVPLTLARTRIDPAVASGVFLTTITDSFGFFIFLALATLFLL